MIYSSLDTRFSIKHYDKNNVMLVLYMSMINYFNNFLERLKVSGYYLIYLYYG